MLLEYVIEQEAATTQKKNREGNLELCKTWNNDKKVFFLHASIQMAWFEWGEGRMKQKKKIIIISKSL